MEPFYNKKQDNFFEKNNQIYYSHHKEWQDLTKKEIYIFILIYTYLYFYTYLYLFRYNKITKCIYELESNNYLKQNWINEKLYLIGINK